MTKSNHCRRSRSSPHHYYQHQHQHHDRKKRQRKLERSCEREKINRYSPHRRSYDDHKSHQDCVPKQRNDNRTRRRRHRKSGDSYRKRNTRKSHRRERRPSTETYPLVTYRDDDDYGRPRNQHDDDDKNNNNNNQKSRVKKKSPSPHHDDNIGHFQGRAGCIIADRYRINKEKGMGTFARVVECLDLSRQRARPPQLRHDNTGLNSIVAVKIVRNVKRYHDSAIIEADIIEDVNRLGRRGSTHCAILYDSFSFRGHYCMVFESLGPSLYDFLKEQKYHPFPVQCVYEFCVQLLETLEFLHSFRLIHTDLKVKRKLSFMNFLI